jgi:hypothetical protein
MTKSLYQWRYPDLPEDLCLLRSDETSWLVTVAHEDIGYFELFEDEWLRLQKNLPGLAATLEKDS